MGFALALALSGQAVPPGAAPELALPERDLLASLDDSLLAAPLDPSVEVDSGNAPAADPLEGPIQPEGDEPSELAEPMRRRWDLQFRFRFAATYDDNIFIQARDKAADLIFHVAPGLTYVLGDTQLEGSFVSLRYDADAAFFLDHSELNAIDHDALLRGQWQGGRLTLGGFFQFQNLNTSDNDVGGRVNRQIYSGGASARWKWSDKTTLELEVEARKIDYETGFSSQELLARSWIEYEYSPLTAISLGLTAGTVEATGNGRQNYAQLLGRVKYEAARKLRVQLRAGIEARESERGRSAVTPVFNLGVVYTPYELLDVHLDGYRNVQPSVSTAGANTVVTGVSAGVNYRFLRRFSASLAGGYEHSEYVQQNGNSGLGRNDNYFFVRGGPQYDLNDHCRIGAFYEFRRNDSSRSDRSFQNHQTTLEASFAY